jgi:hypothetical protein
MKQLYIVILLALALVGSVSAGNCGRWLCGDDTLSQPGEDLNGMTWAQIHDELQTPYVTNLHGWTMAQTPTVSGQTVIWVPWYVYDNDMHVNNLKDTYTQDSYGVNADLDTNTAVTDETSEWWMAAVMNLSYTNITHFNNYLMVCKDDTAGHDTNLTSWICTRDGSSLDENDENSASDATARLATGFFMCALDPDLTTAQRDWCRSRGVNITNAAIAQEFVTSCRDSPIVGAPELCNWRLAGAAQAYGAAALTQNGQQMFIGYHESDIMHFLAAYAATGNETYREYAENETHQFLYVMGYDGSGSLSADFTMPIENLNYYMDCTVEPCTAQSQFDNGGFDDADATRAWETCNNVEFARLVYSDRGLELPWEFKNLTAYCNAWATRVQNLGTLSLGGAQLVSATQACVQITDTATCRDIYDHKQYRALGWASNMVAYKQDKAHYEGLIKGPFAYYDKTNDYYTEGGGSGSPATRGYGIYGQVRNVRSIKAATGYYDFLFKNETFSYTNWATPAVASSSFNACFFAAGP